MDGLLFKARKKAEGEESQRDKERQKQETEKNRGMRACRAPLCCALCCVIHSSSSINNNHQLPWKQSLPPALVATKFSFSSALQPPPLPPPQPPPLLPKKKPFVSVSRSGGASASIAADSEALQSTLTRHDPSKPQICTADELHYVSIPGTDWKLALWRFLPPPEVKLSQGTFRYLFLYVVVI